jgi:hypothetical protein
MDDRREGLEERMGERFDRVDERFNRVDERFDRVDERFKLVDQRFDRVDERFKQVDHRFDLVEDQVKEIRIALKDLHDDNKATNRAMVQGFPTLSGAIVAACALIVGASVV